MMSLDELYRTIDTLSPDQLDDVTRYIQQRRTRVDTPTRPSREEVAAEMQALDAAIDRFRDGLSDEQMNQLAEAMTTKSIDEEDPALFGWVEDIPEDKR